MGQLPMLSINVHGISMRFPHVFFLKKNATSSAVITALLLSQAKKAKETEKVGPHVTEPWKSWLVGGQASPDGHKFQLSEIICQVSCAKFRGFGIQTINILYILICRSISVKTSRWPYIAKVVSHGMLW